MMKTILPLASLLLFTACSEMSFTYNGLRCPTNDMNAIEHDLQQCHVYDLKEVDKAFRNDPECKKCLEAKGYSISIKESDEHNASK